MKNSKKYQFTLTRHTSFRWWMLAVFLVAAASVAWLNRAYFNDYYDEGDLEQFEQVLHGKEQTLLSLFDAVTTDSLGGEIMDRLNRRTTALEELSIDEGIHLYYFKRGRLAYWSEESVYLRLRWHNRLTGPVYFTRNGTYAALHQKTDGGMLYGLILVRHTYPFENEYLESAYQEAYDLSPEVELFRQPAPGLSDVQNSNGDYLFSLNLASNLKPDNRMASAAFIISLLGILALFSFLILFIDASGEKIQRTRRLTLSVLILVVLGLLTIAGEIPRVLFESELFSPDVYASLNIPSLGHLSLLVLILFMFVLLFYWFFDHSSTITGHLKPLVAGVVFATGAVVFIFMHHVGRTMVLDSNISFEPYKLDALSVYTFIGLLNIVAGISISYLILHKGLLILDKPFTWREYLPVLLPSVLVTVPFLFTSFWTIDLETILFYILLLGALLLIWQRNVRQPFSRYFILILAVAFILTLDLQKHTAEKNQSRMEIELAKLSSEHDAVAEVLFPEITSALKSDSLLAQRLSYPIIDIDRMFEYIQRNYFSGYWTKYDLQITVCNPSDSLLLVEPQNRWTPCYGFFSELMAGEGIQVEGSPFYFLNNLNGRISYLGKIPFETRDGEKSLFVELDSKLISEELGYPTLLLNSSDIPDSPFSYAKYNNGVLITSDGDYSYRRKVDGYTSREATFEELREGGFNHTIFNLDLENTVIVSLPVVTLIDLLISFSYLFAFVFVLFSISYLLVSIGHLRSTLTWDFKNKIQYSLIGVLFLTFIVICAGTIYFVIQQYRIKQQDNLENTMRSLYIELIHKVEFEDDLASWSSDKYYNLDELLRKFSNVFYTDINMYDERGMLLATSRSEIFDQQLLSNRMNREAFGRLSREHYSAYIHSEQIGNMTYQSAYVPLLNSENRFLAYLNLPYFTEPEILTQEVTNLVVAILNTYVLLLLVILFLSVFLADRITQPLRFIQNRIAALSLRKDNEKIVYHGRDEIAGLVDEYNYMVEELERSAQLLAQSERESAWREMAKQIAHEIKNPLTPMKLNIQHMQRIISQGTENAQEHVSRVSQTLIEQIDSLAAIAGEFSDFAKMPQAKNREIDILRKLQNVVSLFDKSEGIRIALDHPEGMEYATYGDPEQFQRVIINLVKNGLQAIPEGGEKQIAISVEEAPEDQVVISVSDNGKGIPADIQDRLFQPNFTTKTSGMGMGLAISSSIIKSMNGSIWYRTKKGEGTIFFIKVPLVT